MAKAITKTTTKVTFSHDRMTLTCKFVNGESLRFLNSRASFRLSYEPVASTPRFTPEQVRTLMAASDKHRPGENNGQRFYRLEAYLQTTNSIQEAIVAIARFEAMATIPAAA